MVTFMRPDDRLKKIETFYAALADKTRLRLLYLMRRGETGVLSLADTIGESQPKVSRHLAYLRQAGLVKTRRDGRSIYYSIAWPAEEAAAAAIDSALEWLASETRVAGNVFSSEYRAAQDDTMFQNDAETAEAEDDAGEFTEDHFESVFDEPQSAGSVREELEDFLL